METAGPGLVTGIAQRNGFPEDSRPGHFAEVVVQGHRVGHQLHAVIQGSVMLDVEVLQTVAVGDGQQLTCIVRVLTGTVDLQFHTEVSGAAAPEQGLGLVIVVLNGPVTGLIVAVVAEGLVIVSGSVVGVVLVDDPPAEGAGLVPPVIAVLTQGRGVIAGVFVPPDAGAAVGADHRGAGQTARTEQLAVEFDELSTLKEVSAGIAAFKSFVHIVPPNNKMSPGHRPGLSHRYDIWFKALIFTRDDSAAKC